MRRHALASIAALCLVAAPVAEAADARVQSALSARVHGSNKGADAMVQGLFASYRAQLDETVTQAWTPGFTRNLMCDSEVKKLMARGKSKKGVAAGEVIPLAAAEIDAKREALRHRLDGAEAAMKDAWAAQFRAMDVMTQNLASGGNLGQLPADVTQAALPPASRLQAGLADINTAIAKLQADVRGSSNVVAEWDAITERFGIAVTAAESKLK